MQLRNTPFFRDTDIANLQAFVRDGGYCQYRASPKYPYANYAALRDSVTDHLLPKSKYQCFEREPRNLVACCMVCNKIKGAWDLATDAENEPKLAIATIQELETQRLNLIGRTRRYIAQRPDRWQAMFADARQNFQNAVAEYQCGVEPKTVAFIWRRIGCTTAALIVEIDVHFVCFCVVNRRPHDLTGCGAIRGGSRASQCRCTARLEAARSTSELKAAT